jgi:hypothetical protein
MRRLLSFAVVVVALAATAALSMAAGSSSSSSAPKLRAWGTNATSAAAKMPAPPASAKRLVFFTRQVRSAAVDVGSAGPSAGDSFIFEEQVFDQSHMRVGRDSVACTNRIRSVGCNGTLFVTGRGTITIDSATYGPNVFAVVGGTGEFFGARGELHVRNTSDTTSRLTFFLMRH